VIRGPRLQPGGVYPEGGKLLGGCRATAPAPPPLSAFSWSLKLLVSLPVGSEPCPESGESLAAESWVPGLGPTMLGLGPPMGGLPRLPGGDFHIAGWVNDPPDELLAPNIFASDLVGAGLVVLLESSGDRCRMNCTSWLYSPHLASTLSGCSWGARSLSLFLHLSIKVNLPVFPVAWASAYTTSWHVVFSVTPQTILWMPSTHTLSSIRLCLWRLTSSLPVSPR